MCEHDVDGIHVASRHLNALDGITGILIFDGLTFLQIIEGAEEGVDELIVRLQLDQRHTAFTVRDERVVDERSFPDWSMSLVRVSAGYEFARKEIAPVLPPSVAPAVRQLLYAMTNQLAAKV